MLTNIDQFLTVLSDAGVLTAEQRRILHERFTTDQTPPSLEALSRELREAGHLTDFQADELCRGHGDRLVLGDYLLLDLLARGGMGEVYRARHLFMKRDVAVKLLPPSAAEQLESVERFKREIRAAARLDHPNIVTALDAGQQGGHYFLVMEYVKGEDLGRRVRARGPLPLADAVDYLIQAARGLEYAQRQGVVHRDIKPGNLLLSQEGVVKILDMGLSRLHPATDLTQDEGEADELTRTGEIMGTTNFMAPEQALDPHAADHRADIYSLGCTLYFLVTGWAPYRDGTSISRLIAHREAPIPRMREMRAEAPEQLEAIYLRMMAKKPDDRYQSMEALIGDLDGCLAELRASETSPMIAAPDTATPDALTVVDRPGRVVSRKRMVATIIGVAAVIIVAAVLMMNRPDVPPGAAESDAGDSEATAPTAIVIDGPVDVLSGIIELPPSLLEQGWGLEGGVLSIQSQGGPAVLFVGDDWELPGAYRLRLEARRLSGHGPLVFGLTVEDAHCLVALDRRSTRGRRVNFLGFDVTDGRIVEQRVSPPEIMGEQVEIDIRVEDSGLQVLQDGEVVIDWEGDAADLTADRQGWKFDGAGKVFIGSNADAGFEIRNWTVERWSVEDATEVGGEDLNNQSR